MSSVFYKLERFEWVNIWIQKKGLDLVQWKAQAGVPRVHRGFEMAALPLPSTFTAGAGAVSGGCKAEMPFF